MNTPYLKYWAIFCLIALILTVTGSCTVRVWQAVETMWTDEIE